MEKIGQNVYVETGARGCNVSFVVTKEGVAMIDTPMVPEDAIKWRDEIAKHGTLRYLINTEPHMDHFAGNGFFEGVAIAHEGVRAEILNASLERFQTMIQGSAPVSEQFRLRLPDITLSQRLTIHLGDHTFKLINMPGHTPFQVAVYVPEEKIVFSSDNVVNGVMPYMHQALPYAWLDSLTQLEQLDVDTVVPGHGEVCGRDYLPKMKIIVQAWTDAVKEAIDKGMSLEEVQDKVSLLERFPTGEDREHMKDIQQMNLAHLYEVLKAK